MVGLPEMRRGSLTLVTRPSTVDPAGINVAPFTMTGWLTFPWKGSPTRLLKVARVVSSRTIRAVPAGTGNPGRADTAGTGDSVCTGTAGAGDSAFAGSAGRGDDCAGGGGGGGG